MYAAALPDRTMKAASAVASAVTATHRLAKKPAYIASGESNDTGTTESRRALTQLGDADVAAAHAGKLVDLEFLGHHEGLAVEEIDDREARIDAGRALQRHRRVARQHVELAGRQLVEALLGRDRHELNLGRVAQDRRGDGAAQVHVHALPLLHRVQEREAGQVAVDAAEQVAALLDRFERLLGGGRQGAQHDKANRNHAYQFDHGPLPMVAPGRVGMIGLALPVQYS